MKDCGINENLDISKYLQCSNLLNKVDLILLSHPGYEYTGALAFISSLMICKVLINYFFVKIDLKLSAFDIRHHPCFQNFSFQYSGSFIE